MPNIRSALVPVVPASALVVTALTGITPAYTQVSSSRVEPAPTVRTISASAALSGVFAMKNKTTGRCADLPGFGPGQPNTPVNQYTCNFSTADNQRWTFVPKGTTTGGSGATYNRYQIVNQKDGLCLDAPGFGDNNPGALITEYTCRGTGDAGTGDNQRWYTVERNVNGRTGVWIVNRESTLCLAVAGFGGGNDARLLLAECNNSTRDDHYWSITSRP